MSPSGETPLFTTPHQPQYDHVQTAPLYLLILLPAFVLLGMALAIVNDTEAAVGMVLLAGIVLIFALSFQQLRVVDEGDRLAIRYGPLPIFRRRIPYARIAEARADRTSIIDGWGIHWVPGRGMTYNLWGFDCVRLTLSNGRTVRVGTDDPGGLGAFLRSKCQA